MTQTGGRIDSLDALRGFAILGILLINIQVFSGWGFVALETRQALTWSEWDQSIGVWLDTLVRTKFFSLFSLLFGYSFMMLAQKIEQGPVRYHLRRMLGLLVIGTVHSLLFSPWDILMLYAVMGVFLGAFLNARPGALVIWAFGLLLAVGVALWLGPQLGLPAGRGELALRLLQENVPALSGSSYFEVIRANAYLSVSVLMDRLEGLRPLRVLAMFLLGAAAARLHLAESNTGHIKLLAAVAAAGLGAGVALAMAGAGVQTETTTGRFIAIAEDVASPPLLAMGYGAILLLWWRGNGIFTRGVRSAFAPVGRMAMTNYVLQSAVCISIFYGFGGGRFATISLAGLMLFSVVLFMTQMIVSAIWLRLFNYGPLEWLWRWQVKGKRPHLLKK
ncbi:DUF418 domain-containing protein [Marinobacter sp. LV10MA510-1]|uniref:DUF418 domain-containing protein n=1 Tax=Marinobacter sp. LV10MA510-1 TaxID=1415567 RepID=UPI000BF4ADD4|nr:DUF418 domain-containing protein [Marinobacter sp. LV10MA510-1]PFG11580.1 uncharacterized protein ATI45_4113 [Marinobacter sp. LV10MA510-1]